MSSKAPLPIAVIIFGLAAYLVNQGLAAGWTLTGGLFFIGGGILYIVGALLLAAGLISGFRLFKTGPAVFGLILAIVQLIVSSAASVTDPLTLGIYYLAAGVLLVVGLYALGKGWITAVLAGKVK